MKHNLFVDDKHAETILETSATSFSRTFHKFSNISKKIAAFPGFPKPLSVFQDFLGFSRN